MRSGVRRVIFRPVRELEARGAETPPADAHGIHSAGLMQVEHEPGGIESIFDTPPPERRRIAVDEVRAPLKAPVVLRCAAVKHFPEETRGPDGIRRNPDSRGIVA